LESKVNSSSNRPIELSKGVRVRSSVILINTFVSPGAIFFRISISSIEISKRIRSSGRSSNGDRVGREVGRDIHVDVIESIREISSSAIVRNGESRGHSIEWDRNERAVPSSSSVGANRWCILEGNNRGRGIRVVRIEGNIEVSRSRSVANNVVDGEVSNLSVAIIVAVVIVDRGCSVRSSVNFNNISIN